MTALPGVRLRPLTSEDAAAIEETLREPASDPFNWSGHMEPGFLLRLVAEHRVIDEEIGRLCVAGADDEALGMVSWRRVRTGSSVYSWCWNVGIVLLPDHRGKGYGASAQRALAAYLFETTPVQRIEASTEVDNVAEQRSLEKAGFQREGRLRAYGWRAGRWRDGVLYSILRDEL